MARLNTRPSYRTSTAPSSRYASATPGPGNTSDQENHDPTAARMEKGKGRARDAIPSRASLPTPESGGSGDARGQKRKRAIARTEEDEHSGDGEGEGDEEDAVEAKFNKYFDPNQDPEERRQLKKRSRALERGFAETRDELLRDDGTGLNETISRANRLFKKVKQTNDATLDSRLLVNVSDLAYKKTAQLVLGDTSTGVDVDEFLSKCITYMRNGGPLSRDEDVTSSSRRRRSNAEDSDEEDEDMVGEALDWDFLGRHACFPYNSRPPVPSFLLGPLSVEKKQRTQTQRRARNAKDAAGREARPEALTKDDLNQSEENGLTAICKRIRDQLKHHIKKAERAIFSAGFTSMDELQTERGKAMLRKVRLNANGGVGLFDFTINPRNFGQTVENLFYVSFLIKEGAFGVQNDEEGLPTIILSEASSLEQQRRNKSSKHQAVFSLDYGTWQDLIEAFDIHSPMIPHRQEDESAAQVGQRGWYG